MIEHIAIDARHIYQTGMYVCLSDELNSKLVFTQINYRLTISFDIQLTARY